MIAGFTQDSEAKAEKNIKIGDWLRSINGFDVFKDNLDDVLDQVKSEDCVTLKLQRVAGVEVTKVPPVNELSNQSKFVQQLVNSCADDEELIKSINEKLGGVLYLNMEALSENGNELDAILYAFPSHSDKNVLSNSRGIYMTLLHLIKDITKQIPKLTSFYYNNIKVNVAYCCPREGRLLLLMLPEDCSTQQEIIFAINELKRFMEFTYQTLNRALETDSLKCEIDSFYARFFSKILKLNTQLQSDECVDFEDSLPAALFLNLPKEAQLQIDDALTELEASDYREWVFIIINRCFNFLMSCFVE